MIKDPSKLVSHHILLCALVGVITLPQACHNICIHPLELARVIALAVLAFEADKMISHIADLTTILAVNITCCGGICWRHGLHSDSRIKKRKVFAHVLDALFAERAGVTVPSHVFETREMHHMTTFQPTERFGALEHTFVTYGTIPLKSLRNTMVVIF